VGILGTDRALTLVRGSRQSAGTRSVASVAGIRREAKPWIDRVEPPRRFESVTGFENGKDFRDRNPGTYDALGLEEDPGTARSRWESQ